MNILSYSACRWSQSFIILELFCNPINDKELVVRQRVFVHWSRNCIQWNAIDCCPWIMNNFTSFLSVCNFILQYSWCLLYLCALWIHLWTGHNILLNNELIKICNPCSFYICMKVVILPLKTSFNSDCPFALLLSSIQDDFDLDSKYFLVSG